jgi:hypothetical protein
MYLFLRPARFPWKGAISTFLLFAVAWIAQAESPRSALSVSSDLTSLGISPQNLLPNQSGVNAGPLLEQAIDYAAGHGIATVSLAKGDYYFSVQPGRKAHLTIRALKNVVLNGNGSTFHFGSRRFAGILVVESSSIGVENLTLDYDRDLPSTTAVVGSVDIEAHTVHFAKVLGRPVSDLDSLNPKTSIRIFVLRKNADGSVTNYFERFLAEKGVKLTDDRISLVNVGPNLDLLRGEMAQIRPGDLLSISERDYTGANAVEFFSSHPGTCTGNFARNITIYASPAMGIGGLWQSDLSYSHVTVVPNPSRAAWQFISSNADGLGNSYDSNISVTDCSVQMTGDDGMSCSIGQLGTVATVADSQFTTPVTRFPFLPGELISFSAPSSQKALGTVTVKSVTPSSLPGGGPTIGVDQPLTNVVPGAIIFQAQDKSAYCLYQNNTVRGAYARGLFISGLRGIKVLSNHIENTVGPGIMVVASHESGGFRTPGNRDVLIDSNSVLGAFAWGVNGAHGGIEVGVVSAGADTSERLNFNVSIVQNRSSADNRSGKHYGIYVSNTEKPHVSGNDIEMLQQGAPAPDLDSAYGIRIREGSGLAAAGL